jgi:hypothetical protein
MWIGWNMSIVQQSELIDSLRVGVERSPRPRRLRGPMRWLGWNSIV